MAIKNQIPKSGVSSDELIRAQLRKDNLNHTAEIKMLMAIAETQGLIVDFDEKENEVSIKKAEVTHNAPPGRSQPAFNVGLPDGRVIDLDAVNSPLYEALFSVVKQVLKDCLDSNSIRVYASVDDSVHIKNNDVVMDAIRSRWKEWLQDVLAQVIQQANVSKPKGEMVFQDGADRCYKVPELEIAGSPAPPTEPEKKPSRLKQWCKLWWNDLTSSIFKAVAYEVCFCSLVLCGYLWYKNKQMEHVVKEYGIMKPTLMHHPVYRSFIQSLDSVLVDEDVDDVIERIQKNQHK